MGNAHAEMHEIYTRINSLWREASSPLITDDDFRGGKIAELFRWCRERLGGRDQDLIGPERWELACRKGWSEKAAYSCLPRVKAKQSWGSYVHDVAHWLYPKLPSDDGCRRYGDHDIGHARIELELTELVTRWLADETNGIKHCFPPLKLSRPPDRRAYLKMASQ